MSYISSAGVGIPTNEMEQDEVKSLVQDLFPYTKREMARLLPVFDHAAINKRQFVVDHQWMKDDHSFQEKNTLYQKLAVQYALKAIDDCLANTQFLKQCVSPSTIDLIVFVSSTGIATPSIDAQLLNMRPFREDVKRMPLWGLGCCGGAIGISHAHDWLTAHPDKTALVVCAELCSLTFQKNDYQKSNLIGTALFGDGAAAVLMTGEQSVLRKYSNRPIPKVMATNSFTRKDTQSVMGWNVTNNGLEVVFSKSIPSLVHTLWKGHVDTFLQGNQLSAEDIHSFICHPGGKKVLTAMEQILHCQPEQLKNSYKVLREHGNMSSPTVLYVLKEWMMEKMEKKDISILSALGPGFSSELVLMEWT